MHRIALKLNENVLTAVSALVGEEIGDVFDHVPYMIVEPVGPAEFNLKLVTEDEIFEAAANDSELQVIAF